MREIAVRGTFEQRVSALATEQRGRVSRAQLLVGGLSSSTIARLLRTGYLYGEYPGVYVVGHLAGVSGGEETAALLAARFGAALSHLTGLLWWSMEDGHHGGTGARDSTATRDVTGRRTGRTIHITVPGNHGGTPAGVVVHRSTILTPRDVRIHDGLPVTAPARTLLDVAAQLAPRELERALDTALVRRRVTRREIDELLARAGRHPGRVPLRDLVEAHTRTTFTRSEAEERFLSLVREAGLPEPLINVRRHGFELDFLWPGDERRRGVAVEIDGYAYHAGRAAFERDRRRDGILQRAGIDVLRFTWRRLTEEPLAVIAEVAAVLARLTTFAI